MARQVERASKISSQNYWAIRQPFALQVSARGQVFCRNARLARALEFQDSEQTHFRLRQDICRLWGESYLDDKTGMQLEAGKRALSEIEAQLRAIRGLKQRGLYPLVPAASVVPAQVHRTNILNHDPHYRHLPPLWESLKDEREERQMRPEERLAKHQQLHLAYRDYVGLVLRRALERYGLQGGQGDRLEFGWAGITFSVRQDGQDWLICWRRFKIEPPCRLNFEPGLMANL